MGTCEETLELISAALDGALSDGEQAALREHLSRCPACSALFAELTGLHTAAAELEEIPAPDGFAQRVMERIAADPVQEQPGPVTPFPGKKRLRARWKVWAASAAVVAVAALGAVTLAGRGGMGQATSDTADLAGASSAETDVGAACYSMEDAERSASMEEAESEAEISQAQGEQTTQAPAQSDGAEDSSGYPGGNCADACCGVLTLSSTLLSEDGTAEPVGGNEDADGSEASLPLDCLKEYDGETDSTGAVTYFVPAEYLLACLDQLENQGAAGFTYDAGGDPDAGYGIIVVLPAE